MTRKKSSSVQVSDGRIFIFWSFLWAKASMELFSGEDDQANPERSPITETFSTPKTPS